jgi:hypothetical protein
MKAELFFKAKLMTTRLFPKVELVRVRPGKVV